MVGPLILASGIAGQKLAAAAVRAFSTKLGPVSVINCPMFARSMADENLKNKEPSTANSRYRIFYTADSSSQPITQSIPGVKPLKS